jgi:alpha-beta hydrolase superfamily lysophospholipase
MDELAVESGRDCAEPLFFPSGSHTLFGWLHKCSGQSAAALGLVICKPFGYEAICSHRSVRAFAEAAAAVGVPALRFDYLGTGNSDDLDPSADQIAAWTRDVSAAIEELRRRTGVERVVLLGFRLGALIAALAAAQGAAATALIAVAPVVSGRRYLRELRTIQLAAARDTLPTVAAEGEAPGGAKAEGSVAFEVSGFSLSPASVAALSQIEVGKLTLPLPELLIIDRSELPGAKDWAGAAAQSATKTQYVALPGFVRMMMTAPHFAVTPSAMISAAREWLAHFAGEPTRSDALGLGNSKPHATPSSLVLKLPIEAAPAAESLSETAIFLPSEPRLFAIVTEPRRGEVRRRGVILINAGATHHVGPNRMYVTLARRWAERGYVVLRMDLAGLGDSATRRDRPEGEVYPPGAIDDIRVAVNFMRYQYGITNLTIGGMCSGAYHSLRAAAAALPIKRVLIVNPLNFIWDQSMTLHDLTWLGFVHNPRAYVEQVLPARLWKKLLSGQVNVPRLLKLYAQYFVVVLNSTLRNVARMLHIPLPGDLGYELQAIGGRGTEMVFLFARGDPGISILAHQGGSSLRRLGALCRIYSIDGADHIFSQYGARQALERILSAELFARQAAPQSTADNDIGGPVHGEHA